MSDAAGMNHWIDPNGILHVQFDRSDDKVNLLTPEILRELGEILDSLRGHEEIRG
jgi:enoyl-CoA hydratase/carnithine racemase